MHQEYYNKKGEEVPSVTTVLKILQKDGLLQWANSIGKRGIDYQTFLNNKATFGTIVHELLESYLTGSNAYIICSQNTMTEAMYLVDKFKAAREDLRITNVTTEIPLTCDEYGGTIDIICDIITDDGYVTILGDFKTSKKVYETHFIQLGGYLNLIKLTNKKLYDKIQLCAIFSITEEKVVMKYITKENCEKYFTKIFLELLAVYKSWHTITRLKDIYKSKSY